MRVVIDASIFTREAGAYGKVGGSLNLPCEPQVGDRLSFVFPSNKAVQPLASIPSFSRQLLVEERLISPIGAGNAVIVMLEDITVDTISQANALNEYFTNGFGLDVEVWDATV